MSGTALSEEGAAVGLTGKLLTETPVSPCLPVVSLPEFFTSQMLWMPEYVTALSGT